MTAGVEAERSAQIWSDAALAVELVAVAPRALGGMLVRSAPGPHRDRIQSSLRDLLPITAPMLRLPSHITADRLLGGLTLASTLQEGRPVFEQGLLARTHLGVVVIPMAERLNVAATSAVCAALDTGALQVERDGVTASVVCAVGVLALDEGLDDEHVPGGLADRLAFHVDLDHADPRSPPPATGARERTERARRLVDAVVVDAVTLKALAETSAAFGITSVRAIILAAAAARAHAALEGRAKVDPADAAAGARLVLAPRATRLPVAQEKEREETESDQENASSEPPSHPEGEALPDGDDERDGEDPAGHSSSSLEDVLVAAVRSGVPAGLLGVLTLSPSVRTVPRTGRSGATAASGGAGRPVGARALGYDSGARLHVIETLRAAAPWQRLRGRAVSAARTPLARGRLQIRREDFRIVRFLKRSETLVIFSVDASGSSAAQRLAEAKGAVEQVLSECYVRRDHVALFAFRGADASLALPPTRSLTRARRSLANLTGGGLTPLAAGIDAARALAEEAQRSGRSPVIVLMTDGRANVARDGSKGGSAPTDDALGSARAVRARKLPSLFLDTSPRPQERSRALAIAMGALYLPLPHARVRDVAQNIRSLARRAP